MPITPKAFFLSSKENVSAHARAVESLINTRAAETALLEYQISMASRDGSEAAANQFKLEGALHEAPPKPAPRPSHNLNPT